MNLVWFWFRSPLDGLAATTKGTCEPAHSVSAKPTVRATPQPFTQRGCATARQMLFCGMTTTTNPPSSARTFALPNLLTYGRMLDPIADKLLVSSCLLMLAADGTIRGWALWAAIVILCREILVSGLREYLAELRVSVPVTSLAKWKTFLQLLAVGFLIAGEAGDLILPITSLIGIALLWLSALLT